MKPTTIMIILSVAANAVLAMRWREHTDSVVTQSVPSISATPKSNTPAKELARDDQQSSFAPSAGTLPPLSGAWSRIQSENLKEYVSRLRAIGCPEETVQDIILAEVDRIFGPRKRAVFNTESKDDWWKSRDYDYAANRERSQLYKQLETEESAMLVDILGADPRKAHQDPDDLGDTSLRYLPREKREAVQKVVEEFDDKRQELYQRNRNIWDSQTRNEQHVLEQDEVAALSQILSPDQLQQWKLHSSQLANQLQHDLSSLNLTEDQYKTIFTVREKYGDSIYNYAGNSPEESAASEKAQEQIKIDMQAALGPDMAKQYERSQDYQFKQLSTLAKKFDLPAGTADKIYDVKSTAEDAATRVRNDSSLSDEARQKALQDIRDETEKAVKNELGDKPFKSYQRNGGWWLNNLSPRRMVVPKP